jgi:hypothetical protein
MTPQRILKCGPNVKLGSNCFTGLGGVGGGLTFIGEGFGGGGAIFGRRELPGYFRARAAVIVAC